MRLAISIGSAISKIVLYRLRKNDRSTSTAVFNGLNIELKEVLELEFDCIFASFLVLRSYY